ncbi:glycosyltransferase family protein [Methylobacterium sp. CM6244]
MTQRPGPGETKAPSPWLHLVGTGHPPCGVGDFAGQLIEALRRQGQPQETLPLEPGRVPLGEIWRAVGNARAVIANLPLVPWKRALIGPPSAFAIAFLRRRRRVAILHEWGSMHRLRRLVLRPLLLFADTIVLLSPQVRDELAADPVIGRLARRAVMMPLPPNITRPETTVPSALSARMRAAREGGRLVVGHFGSIYPGKQPEAILDIAATLKARGADPLVVFIGSFIRASDGIEEIFRAKVAALDLSETVVVSGYVASPEELFGLFDEVDAFVYVLPEGLTARRASILACVQAGRPVIVTEPVRADEFDHHPRFQALLSGGAIVLAPGGAGPEAYVDLALAASTRPTLPPAIDRQVWFADAAGSLRDALGRGATKLGRCESWEV